MVGLLTKQNAPAAGAGGGHYPTSAPRGIGSGGGGGHPSSHRGGLWGGAPGCGVGVDGGAGGPCGVAAADEGVPKAARAAVRRFMGDEIRAVFTALVHTLPPFRVTDSILA